jgi:hypothetical protein
MWPRIVVCGLATARKMALRLLVPAESEPAMDARHDKIETRQNFVRVVE